MMETLGDRHTLFPSAPCRPAPSLLPSSAPSDYHCPGRAAFSLNLTLVSRSALLLCRARRARSAIGNSDSVRLFRPFFAFSFPSVGSRASDAAISDDEPPPPPATTASVGPALLPAPLLPRSSLGCDV